MRAPIATSLSALVVSVAILTAGCSRPPNASAVQRIRVAYTSSQDVSYLPSIAAIDYVAAQNERRRLIASMARMLEHHDVLVTSGPYAPPPRIEEAAADWVFNKPEITVAFSLTGFPAISICNGFTSSGFPLSMQIVGRPFDEAMVLRVARSYEHDTLWHRRRPDL